MLKKALFAVLLLSLCLLLGITKIHFSTLKSSLFDLLSQEPPSEFYIYTFTGKEPKEILFLNHTIIQEFHNRIKDKSAKRVYERPSDDELVLIMDYGYKGNMTLIDQDGRVYIYKNRAVIRNKSWLHWVWWKLDGIFWSKGSTHLIYVTEADSRVVELADKIMRYESKDKNEFQ